MMEQSSQKIKNMEAEIVELKEQNAKLKKMLQQYQQKEQSNQFNQIRNSYQPPRINQLSQNQHCSQCQHCRRPSEKSRKQLVQDFQIWSLKLNNNFPLKKHLSEMHSSQGSKQDGQMHQFFQVILKQQPLIQQICLFGPNEQQMQSSDKNSKISHQLYFPENNPGIQIYGNYLYPQKVGFKLIKQSKKDIDIDKILFRKSFKQQDCNVFIFQSRQQRYQQQKQENEILKKINPFRSLYIIGLQFSDFLVSSKSLSELEQKFESFGQDKIEDLHSNQEKIQASTDIIQEDSNIIFKSHFNLCILSYFPFVDFFCQLLVKIIDHIKIRRMEMQTQIGKKYEQLDIKYVAKQLSSILLHLSPTIQSFSIKEGSKMEMNFGTQHLSLNLETGIKQTLTYDWAFRILKLFDRELLYQIYCFVMLQQSVCVVCQNTYILTFVIHLLVSLMPKPFIYPHPIVSIVFEQELLDTPFTAILGINKGTKWLQSNDSIFAEKMQGKVILQINDDQIKIKSKKKSKLPKSQKLKKIFTTFYKKIEKIDDKFFKKRQLITRELSRTQNEATMQLFGDLQQFYKEQLLNFMPNREIIDSIRSNIVCGDNQAFLNAKLIKSIEQYILQSRKRRENDPMVDLLMQKQIFYVYLTEKYDIA